MRVSAAERAEDNAQHSPHLPVTRARQAQLIEWAPEAFALGVSDMDATHQAFIDLLNRLDTASNSEFPKLFHALLAHTQTHFDSEETHMRLSGFPALTEHCSEHRRVLGELAQIQRQLDKGGFRLHATM